MAKSELGVVCAIAVAVLTVVGGRAAESGSAPKTPEGVVGTAAAQGAGSVLTNSAWRVAVYDICRNRLQHTAWGAGACGADFFDGATVGAGGGAAAG